MRRSVLFMAPTAEESGLLGVKFYATHPLYPLEKTLADFNIDGVNPWGRTRDIENVSEGHSDLDELLVAAAAAQGRVVVPDTQPEKGMVYRADHFEFFKRGVPSLYCSGGKDVIGQPEGFGLREDERIYRAAITISLPTGSTRRGICRARWRMRGCFLRWGIGWRTARGFRSGRRGRSFRGRRVGGDSISPG